MASAARSYFKKGMKAPDRAVVLSLVAVLIVCAAPCFVTYMDAKVTDGVYADIESEYSLSPINAVVNSEEIAYVSWSGLSFGTIDDGYFLLNDTGSDVTSIKFDVTDEENDTHVASFKALINSGVTRFVFKSDSEDISSVSFQYYYNGSWQNKNLSTEEGSGVYVLDFNSTELIKLKSSSNFVFKISCSGGLSSGSSILFDFVAEEPATDYSGSAIVGFFGIVLIVLAICCTNLINPLRRM